MPEQVRCPSCNAALRVPDNLLGKNVKCPKCQETFLAEVEEPPARREEIVREPAPRRRPRPPEDVDELEELPQEEEFEEGPEEERPRRRRGGRRRAAEAAVSGPANALLAVGIIDLVLGALNMLLSVLGASLMTMGGGGRGEFGNPDEVLIGTGVRVVLGVAALILGLLILMGALRMKKLTSYGFAMTACILAMIPCVNCCILGLPFGIWALVVLNRPEVKDAFQ